MHWEKFLEFHNFEDTSWTGWKENRQQRTVALNQNVLFLFLFQVSPSPCRHKSTPSSFQSRRRNPSSAIRKSAEEKKRNEALCGREDTKGDLKQNGFEAVELARLKITINDDKIVVKSKLFP